MKLVAVNGSFYSFMSCTLSIYKKDYNWLLHEDEFFVHWVANGPHITGEELEKSYFIHFVRDPDADSETDSDISHYLEDSARYETHTRRNT